MDSQIPDVFNKKTYEGFEFSQHRERSFSGKVLIFSCLYCKNSICQDPIALNRWANMGVVCPHCKSIMFLSDFIRKIGENPASLAYEQLPQDLKQIKK